MRKSILGIDLGGSKLAVALFSVSGEVLFKDSISLGSRSGEKVGELIKDQVKGFRQSEGNNLKSIGVSVPGISWAETGTVWAPNIPGWEAYPLLEELRKVSGNSVVVIDSDRACSILGEIWQGNAKGCQDAIFLAVGTGIGAGILTNGEILRGANDIGGAIGWMALSKPFRMKYLTCGCFEYYASGEGIARLTRELIQADPLYQGKLKKMTPEEITAYSVFDAYEDDDMLANRVIHECIEYWGMAAANLVSLFNPKKIIFGGGVFGPAVKFIPSIKEEAAKWAQPISMSRVTIEPSALQGEAGVFGAGYLALKKINGI